MSEGGKVSSSDSARGKVKRRQRGVEFSDTEWSELEASAKEAGHGNINRYIRDRLFMDPVPDDGASPGHPVAVPENLQWRLLTLVLHQHKLLEKVYGKNGMGDKFENELRKAENEITLASRTSRTS